MRKPRNTFTSPLDALVAVSKQLSLYENQRGNINDAAQSIAKRNRQLPFRQHAEYAQTPWSGGWR